mgnify:CR=1 FL=1
MSKKNKDLVELMLASLDEDHEPPAEHFTNDAKIFFLGDPPMDLETYKQASKGFFRAFPDLKHTIEELIEGENDTVIVRETIVGTHRDTFMDIPATGCRVRFTGTLVLHMARGKVRELHSNFDMFGLLNGIGAVKILTEDQSGETSNG